jgi:predicted phosphodiesterase
VRTLLVSDLHLGAGSGGDVLRSERTRAALLAEVERADQVVLLGDVLELRGTPAPQVLERATPALAEIGEAAGDARVVVVPGNHDYRPAADWIDRRRQRGTAAGLRTVETWRPGRAGIAARLARALGARELILAYPGLWIRPDVWATHGHYLDCHNTVPAIEVLAAAGVGRLTGVPATGPRTPDAYEAMLAPVYAFNYEVAQAATSGRRVRTVGGSVRLWRRLMPDDGGPTVRSVLLGGVLLPGAVAAVNRAGLGRFSPDLSRAAVRRAALKAMGEVVERLDVEAEHVVFGHTHRAGPLPGDRDDDGWAAPGGRRLWNCGNWIYEPGVAGPPGRRSGHWPGVSVVVDDDGPPRLERLLDEDAMSDVIAAAERGAATTG